MTIEIHQPELEALIQRRIDSGDFQNVEEILLKAMRSLPEPDQRLAKQNLADFLLRSPLAGSGLVTERVKDYPLPVAL